ncbi:hypothetical protein AB833_28760 [Chromatiales bacterium (ex Bugula neritina AB1)]|nr:hypothetical protein AB833_28760 [Chromatiales bacterium (ex Bugula neritina AB1)]
MQVSQRLAGTHPDKLLDTLQRHIDDGHEQSSLQAIPDLQMDYPQFHNELEQLKAKLSDKLLDGVKVLDKKQAQIFRCVNCGGGLSRQSLETRHVVCQYCGCDAEHPAADLDLRRWNQALDLESNFTIGDFFTYKDQRWQAVGVQLFSGRVREYDTEDNEWESNFCRYTNWWMLNERREVAWLIDDGSRRYWSQKYIPMEPELPDSHNKNFEHGQWKLEFAAGEFSYQPSPDERHNSAENTRSKKLKTTADSKQRFYTSVESRLDQNGEVREIEFFKSAPIPHEDMVKGLGKDSALNDIGRWRKTMRVLMVAFPLLAAMALYLNRGGDKITELVPLASGDQAVQMQQFNISEAGRMLNLKGSINGIQNNSWFGVDVSLLNSDDQPVYGKYLEFWHETGHDSDGAWSERDTSADWYIRVDEPDTYRVMVAADPASTTPDADFRLTIEPNRISVTPFIVGAAIAFLFIALSRSKASSVGSGASSIAVKVRPRTSGKPTAKS